MLLIDMYERLWKFDRSTNSCTRITGQDIGESYCTDIPPDDLINLHGPLGIPGSETVMPVWDFDGDSWYYDDDRSVWVCARDNSVMDTLDEIQSHHGPLHFLPRTPKEKPELFKVGSFIKPVDAVYEVLEVFDDQTAEVRDVANDNIHHVLMENYEETDAPLPKIGDVYVQKGVGGSRGLAFIVKEHVGNHTITLGGGGIDLTLDARELRETNVWTRIH